MDIRGLHMPWRTRVDTDHTREHTPPQGGFLFDTTQMPSTTSGSIDISEKVGVSAVAIIDALIAHGYHAHVSDVHIDPTPSNTIVRMRIDGQLSDVYTIPNMLHSQVIARIKILAGLRTDEHTAPHDGRFRSLVENNIRESESIDVRVSITPTYHGENAVLRLLVKTNAICSITDLGLAQHDQAVLERALSQPYGLIIATGPTGSGKTTTLYTLLERLNKPHVSIVTLEDPIEYAIAGIRQIQINPTTGFTFGTGLRSIVRQDPDIVMVGEIRDTETAQLAVGTAMTGHMVLTTLHTNDAVGGITRLYDMRVEPYLIASTMVLMIAQRLVRRVCNGCRTAYDLTDEDRCALSRAIPPVFIDAHARFVHGRGCGECRGTGYRGRVGAYELCEFDESARAMIARRENESAVRSYLRTHGSRSVACHAYEFACRGITSVSEVVRLIHS